MGHYDFRNTLKAKKKALPSKKDDKAPLKQDAPTRKRQMDEGELMAAAFHALSTGEVNIEWDATQVVQSKAPCASPSQPATLPAPTPPPEAASQKKAPPPTSLDPSQWQGRDWGGQDWLSGQHVPIDATHPFSKLRNHQLSPTQLRLLEKVTRLHPAKIQELNLRYQTRNQAMAQLRRTVAQMRRFGQRYLRIITGKGIGSSGAPILRQEVVHWCILQANRQALQWTPEPENNREYGAIFVDLLGPITPT